MVELVSGGSVINGAYPVYFLVISNSTLLKDAKRLVKKPYK